VEIALAEIVVRRDREGADFGQAARQVLDVFVQPEHFEGDQDHRRVLRIGGSREIRRHLAIGDLHLGVAGAEPGRIRVDRVGADRACGKRVAGGRGCRQCRATGRAARR